MESERHKLKIFLFQEKRKQFVIKGNRRRVYFKDWFELLIYRNKLLGKKIIAV